MASIIKKPKPLEVSPDCVIAARGDGVQFGDIERSCAAYLLSS